MIIPMLCVTIFVILVVWFLLPRVARLMIHTPTAISIFVFQAEDGIRDRTVTGVQTCALPIYDLLEFSCLDYRFDSSTTVYSMISVQLTKLDRSEERRVGKECKCWYGSCC